MCIRDSHGASRKLGSQMKATGEVMSIAHTFEAALMGYGRLAIATVRENSHLHSVGRIAADITCVSSFVLGKITP